MSTDQNFELGKETDFWCWQNGTREQAQSFTGCLTTETSIGKETDEIRNILINWLEYQNSRVFNVSVVKHFFLANTSSCGVY